MLLSLENESVIPKLTACKPAIFTPEGALHRNFAQHRRFNLQIGERFTHFRSGVSLATP
jgi:hypothetical protein